MTAHKPSTRDTILDAAETVVGRDGARRLTIDAVAAEACVSKGGVLYHFPNKIALLKGMVERMMADVSQDFANCEAAAHAAGEPPLVHVFNAMFDRHDARKALSMALLAASAEHPDLLDPARDFLSSTFQRLSDDTPDPIGARLLLLAMDGLKLSALLGFDTIPENQLTQIRDRLVRLTHELYQ